VTERRLSRHVNSGSALASYGASKIQQHRAEREGQSVASQFTAHVLLTLKHPREVQVLRRVYGPGFFLIAVHAEEATRIAHLVSQGMTEDEATRLVVRDQYEVSDLGQRTRDTFQLADVFLRMSQKLEDNVQRFVDLVFGSPKEFPTPDEQAMLGSRSSVAIRGSVSTGWRGRSELAG
jgi:hypothetical protein